VVRGLGADDFVDHTVEDFTRRAERYDLVFDVPGNHTFRECCRVLAPGGRYVLIGHDQYGAVGRRWLGSLPRFARLMAMTPFRRQLPPLNVAAPDKTEGMTTLAELLDAGKLTPVVDRTFDLAQVPDAIRYLAEGHARGRVVITVGAPEPGGATDQPE
jgi:NADPH:quinone reductase-like Zn-dependent oxidoreductase